jgi:hypothetical protein
MRRVNRKVFTMILAAALVGATLACPTALAATPDTAADAAIAEENFGELGMLDGDLGGFGGPGGLTVQETAPAYQGPTLTVEGEIYGTANTNGGSCVVASPDGSITYESGVTLVLTQDGLDDSKIDSSNAKVELVDGDGYTVSELKFTANSLTGTWKNGKLEYSIGSNDLTWNNDAYAITAQSGCGREWSCFGGDGAGHYYFRLQVSGILYDGEEVETQIIPLHVYIYGRSATDLANMNYGTLQPSWSWNGTGDKPILCDDYADEFVAKWPASVDASGVTTADVTVTLTSEYGDTLTLEAGKDYTVSAASKGQTTVEVTYENWAFTPVYTQMSITVAPTHLVYDTSAYKMSGLTYTTDIASVYAYSVQSGGMGMVDHAVCYTYYGVELNDWQSVQLPTVYRLSYTDENGKTWYYASRYGIGYLTENKDEAQTWDATGADEMNYQVVDGHMVYLTLCNDHTADKWVGLRKYTFTKVYASAFQGNAFDYYGSIDPCDNATFGIAQNYTLQAGYALPDTWLEHSMWAWKADINTGWVE